MTNGGVHPHRHFRQSLGVILNRGGKIGNCHVGIPDGLDLFQTMTLRERVEHGKNIVQEPHDLGGGQAGRQRREIHDVGEQHPDLGEIVGDSARRDLQALGNRRWQDVEKQALRPGMLRLQQPEQVHFLIAQALLFQARSHTRPEKRRVKRLTEVIVRALIDTPDDRLHVAER